MYNPDLAKLRPYPFERLRALLADTAPPSQLAPIPLSIGEPKHAPPRFIVDALAGHLETLSGYPTTRGLPALRAAICGWLERRFEIAPELLDPERHVLPVNGTREALFAVAQALLDRADRPLVLMPNPFYQIYEGAALLAGAEPWFLNCIPENGLLPDLDAVPDAIWGRCRLVYLCSPGNPTGSVAPAAMLARLLELAERHDFVIASDECYSELYDPEQGPPPGLLGVAAALGHSGFQRCLVFHSLSKRSNVPGLRSGFVAGDPVLIEAFHRYRTYHGCAMPLPTQQASIAAWNDEAHVVANRSLYDAKFRRVREILGDRLALARPAAGFYFWPKTPIADTAFAHGLHAAKNVTVLPGSFLARDAHGINPGARRVRIALVAGIDQCEDAASRIRDYIDAL